MAAHVLGGLSLVSGLAVLVAPRAMMELYGMPVRLAPVLGIRDIAIGAAFFAPRLRRLAAVGRALGDGMDALVIATNAKSRSAAMTAFRLLVAVGSAYAGAREATSS